jgi:hypothetical protein
MSLQFRLGLPFALAIALFASGAPAPAQAQTCDPLLLPACLLPGWEDPMQITDCPSWDEEWSVILSIPYPCIPPMAVGVP